MSINMNSDNQAQQAAPEVGSDAFFTDANLANIAQPAEGQAAQEGLTADAQAQQAPAQSGQGGQQELIAGKFKSIDDLRKSYAELVQQLAIAKAQGLPVAEDINLVPTSVEEMINGYKDLEREFHRVRQLASQQPAVVDNQQQQAEVPELTDEQINQLLLEAFQKDPVSTLNALLETMLEERLQPLMQDYEERLMTNKVLEAAQKYPDFKDLANDIADFLDAHPEIGDLENALDIAYLAVKGMKAQEFLEQGKQQAYQNMAAKQQAVVETDNLNKAGETVKPEDLIIQQIFGEKPKGIFG
jgi:hypothetical protein